jgi:hypothetical protein
MNVHLSHKKTSNHRKSKQMKTLSTLIVKISIIVTAASLFFLTSCRKEEPAAPSANVNLSQAKTSAVNKIEPPNYGFMTIQIDHTRQIYTPEYSVTVRYDGWVTFEGRKNCAYNHIITFYVPYENVSRLQNLFLNTNFFEIADALKTSTNSPAVLTTCINLGSGTSKTLTDFNKGYPAALIYFRTKAESLMGITKYVGYEN